VSVALGLVDPTRDLDQLLGGRGGDNAPRAGRIGSMRSLRLLPAALLLVLAPALTACGGDDGDDGGGGSGSSDSRSPTEAGTDASTPTTTPGVPTLPAACDAVSAADVEAAYGVSFGEGEEGGGGHSEQNLEWQSDNCSWTAIDLLEVELELTGADDFSGAFDCPEPREIASTVEPIDGLGDHAWWEVDDDSPLKATLRVCTEDYNFDIALDYEDGVDFVGNPKDQSIALAGVVLAALA
jgi:hypothetical protein